MSTRCNIGVYENKEDKLDDFYALLYRHSDGYPEGVLPEIVPFLKWWDQQRGIGDTEYCGARLLQYLCNQSDGGPAIKTAELLNKNTDYTGIYGYGICKYIHWDIEYFYKIYPKAVEVYETPFKAFNDSTGKIDFKQWELTETVKL